MNKHLLSNVLFLDIEGYLKLADSLHFKKFFFSYCSRLSSTSITTDDKE